MTQLSIPPELLPCPFCGGKALYHQVGTGGYGHFVVCSSCQASGGFKIGDCANAAALWNERKTEKMECTPDET